MNLFMNKIRNQTMHFLRYAIVFLFGVASFAGGPTTRLQTQWQDAMLMAKSYQVDEVAVGKDVRKDFVEEEDGSSIEDKKIKRLTGAQPLLASAPFATVAIWNKGEDLAFISSHIDWLFQYQDHISIPLGSLAPPMMTSLVG